MFVVFLEQKYLRCIMKVVASLGKGRYKGKDVQVVKRRNKRTGKIRHYVVLVGEKKSPRKKARQGS
jgi:ribosomal protein L36